MANFAFAPVRTFGKKLTATTETVLYTVDANSYAQVIGVRVANVTATPANATVSWFSFADNATYTLIHQQSVPGNMSPEYVFEVPVALNSKDSLKFTAGTANAFHTTLSVIEIPGRSG
jgi:hypothetical protein